jgi:hypothetical protein
VLAVSVIVKRSVNLNVDRGAKGRAAASEARKKQADARAAKLIPIIVKLWAAGITSPYGIAKALNAYGVPTPAGKKKWQEIQARRVLARLK